MSPDRQAALRDLFTEVATLLDVPAGTAAADPCRVSAVRRAALALAGGPLDYTAIQAGAHFLHDLLADTAAAVTP